MIVKSNIINILKGGRNMKKRMNKFKIAIIVFFLSLILSNISNASDLQLQKLEYNVILKEDGTAEVTEKWNIWMEDTNTLFKTFEIDKRYTTISMKPHSHNFEYELRGIELGNELALNEYVQSVLDILNEFSPIIQFSISEYMIPHENGRIFKIKCIF